MATINRRTAIAGTLAAGATASRCFAATKQEGDELSEDQKFVIAAGMTEAEADCWKKVAAAAGSFFELPELHPTDKEEVATAIHVLQNKLLGRPTYRKYLELAKAHHGAKRK